MAERGPDSLPTTSLGHYKVRGKIGSGGMGDVYDAVHTGLDKRVALKTLRKRFLDDDVVVARFLREGQLASRIRHPNIVDVTDVGMMGGLPCLVMEHLEGESLSALIRREGALPVERIVDLLLPIVAAVDVAHEHGVLHRDLKPSNIFLSRVWNGDTVPKVLDFGISKLVHESQQAALTTDASFVGTPHYASPESMRADKSADGRSDQYSMGVILYEAATGGRPYAAHGNNFVALAMAICKGEYPPAREHNPQIPVAFERVIQTAMALDAHDRFASMGALGGALLPFASERTRMIWAPTFAVHSAAHETSAADAGLFQASSTAVLSRPPPMSIPGATLGSPRTNPSLPTASSISGPPSGTPPGAAFDPSYGAGTSAPSAARPRGRGTGWLTTVIGVALGLAIVGSVIVVRSGSRSDEASPPANASTTTDPEGPFTVELQVTPATALIELDGALAGTGRASRSFPRDGKKHILRLSAPGHETLLLEFDEGRPPPPAIGLRPAHGSETLTAPSAAPSPPEAPPYRPSSPGAGGKAKGSSDSRPKTDNINPWE